MHVTDFLAYLVGRDASRDLPVQLVEVYQARARRGREAVAAPRTSRR
jgi:hypothetical protein